MTYKLKLAGKEEILKDTFGLYFDKGQSGIKFLAGQFVTVTIPDLNAADGKGNERHFSIANSPNENNIEIIIRKSGSDFSNAILNLPLGSQLLFDEPRGEIHSRKLAESNFIPVFIAGGTGITPVRSIMRDFEEKGIDKEIILFYANRSIETAVFLNEFENLSKEKNNFTFIPILENSSDTKTERGYFSQEIFKKYVNEIDKHVFFVTGPPMMLSEAIKVLVNSGVPEDKIFIENI
ncbi:MAG: FAD-dependent oxidoreductase [Ignavibacteria bacterium]|jgi:NAD(P)H-flavin reductase|nr:FAD-dependent oxidoreductase [Ignavibacteria bacterium]